MKSLFKTVAKKISTEKQVLDKDSLPKTVLSDYRVYTAILSYNRYCTTTRVPPLPTIPEECFVFYKDMGINFRRTFERAEKVMDPVDTFIYYVELGNFQGQELIWNQLDGQQKDRVYDCADEVVGFLGYYLETGTVLPGSNLDDLYEKAKSKVFTVSAFIYGLCSVPLRRSILLSEFCTTLECQDIHWVANCEHLANLVKLKDFEINADEMHEGVAADIESTIRSNHSNFLRLPKNCRIPELEDFARERIGPYVPYDVPDSGYSTVVW
uniref:Terpene_synth_C domain-containing protein n=1 Tax=Steinernema glaseri TaxID=37863 RepID=A0A1I8AH08_9BILA